MSIGASVVVKGDIVGGEDLVILGRVEGNIQLRAGTLTLALGSHVVGDVSGCSVLVDGQVEGNVGAAEKLEIRPTAVVNGNITSRALVVSDGATINGRVEMPALARPHLVHSAARVELPVAV